MPTQAKLRINNRGCSPPCGELFEKLADTYDLSYKTVLLRSFGNRTSVAPTASVPMEWTEAANGTKRWQAQCGDDLNASVWGHRRRLPVCPEIDSIPSNLLFGL